MESRDLTPEQAAILRERIRSRAQYLHQLQRRMYKRHFPPQDQLRQKVNAAYDATYRLFVELHYMSCGRK
jgi:hypothetical protein